MNQTALRTPFPPQINTHAIRVGLMLMPVFAAIHFGAYWFRFDGTFSEKRWVQLGWTMAAVLLLKTITFTHYRVFQGWSRYATFFDAVRLTQAATVSACLLALFDYLFLASLHTPRAVFFTDWIATVALVGGLRSARRWLSEGTQWLQASQGQAVLIVGADDDGEGVLSTMRRRGNLQYNVVGFLGVTESEVGRMIGGVPVVGTVDMAVSLAQKFGVRELLIASSAITGKQVRQIVDSTADHGISVNVLPSYEQMLSGRVDWRPRTVSISDLLRRDPVELDTQYLNQWLGGKAILVTGAAGSIGSEICRQLLPFHPKKLIVVDRSENGQFFLEKELRKEFPAAEICVCIADIADRDRMTAIFRQQQPDVIFHAAAYKHVPLMEVNCTEAIKNIPLATKHLADLADEMNVESFVMISTDKAVNPTSVMGCSKRVAEIYVQALASKSSCRFVTVRFGNVLGSNGSVVPIFAKQIAEGGPVTVTHPEMQRYFMMIPEASQLVIQAGAMGQGGEIFVLDMGEPVRIVDLARDMVRLSGLREGEDIEIQFTGIRPGEKLFEELHIDGETHVHTKHPKIMVAKCQETPLEDITRSLQKFQMSAAWDDDTVVQELERIVPEFRPTRFGEPQYDKPPVTPARRAA